MNNSQPLIDLNKKFRSRVSVSLNESKASYYYNYFQKNNNNMKQLWSGIKSVINIRKSSSVNIMNKLKDSNGNITSNSAVIASIFNKLFVNVSHDITKNTPTPNKTPVNFMGGRLKSSFSLHLQFHLI